MSLGSPQSTATTAAGLRNCKITYRRIPTVRNSKPDIRVLRLGMEAGFARTVHTRGKVQAGASRRGLIPYRSLFRRRKDNISFLYARSCCWRLFTPLSTYVSDYTISLQCPMLPWSCRPSFHYSSFCMRYSIISIYKFRQPPTWISYHRHAFRGRHVWEVPRFGIFTQLFFHGRGEISFQRYVCNIRHYDSDRYTSMAASPSPPPGLQFPYIYTVTVIVHRFMSEWPPGRSRKPFLLLWMHMHVSFILTHIPYPILRSFTHNARDIDDFLYLVYSIERDMHVTTARCSSIPR